MTLKSVDKLSDVGMQVAFERDLSDVIFTDQPVILFFFHMGILKPSIFVTS
ncbi:MAG TPA: hypothetical protein VEG65_03655 [Candidatus Bathyarchaeia archaeon]|nr:hypothetical protein [Candidatus Bathyarchaeia archaeon]